VALLLVRSIDWTLGMTRLILAILDDVGLDENGKMGDIRL
jgi:hypothetical protein